MSNVKPKIENQKSPRGAPRGNHNALKHGFYSRQLNRADWTDLDSTNPNAVDGEIALLRVCIRRLMEASRGLDDYSNLVDLNRSLCLAFMTLARLIRTRFLIGADRSEDDAAFDQAVQELFGHRTIFRDDPTRPPPSDPTPDPDR
jgi:hypothetical protein